MKAAGMKAAVVPKRKEKGIWLCGKRSAQSCDGKERKKEAEEVLYGQYLGGKKRAGVGEEDALDSV